MLVIRDIYNSRHKFVVEFVWVPVLRGSPIPWPSSASDQLNQILKLAQQFEPSATRYGRSIFFSGEPARTMFLSAYTPY